MSEHLTVLQVDNPNEAVMLLGISDANMKLIEEALQVHIITRGEQIQLAGEEDAKEHATFLLHALLKVIRKGINIDQRDVATAIEMTQKERLNILQNFMMKKLHARRKESLFVQNNRST